MKKEAILHIPMSEYAYGLSETQIVYRLRCARGDLKKVTLYYGDTACRVTPIIFTPVEMKIAASDSLHDYWQVVVDSLYNRVYYYFVLDDGQEQCYYYGDIFTNQLVDDRSQYFKLPFNHRADIVREPEWVKDAVVYNIFPDSFASGKEKITGKASEADYHGQTVRGKLGGTLKGVAENVAYLKDLGINCIYLNPIFTAGEYHKYDLLDYFHVDPCFGGDDAFRSMVETLHGAGIKVIIDGVFNHCGWYFFAFDDVVKNGEKSRYKDWFYDLTFPVQRPEDPEMYPTYACFAYERMMPKLATDNPEVQEYFCKVAAYWVREFQIDGWRLDVASEVNDDFWRAFRKAVKRENPDALLIGEVWETANHWLQGDMFDSTMNYDFRKHCNLFFAEESIDAAAFSDRITNMLMRYRMQTTQAQLNLLDSHDVGRFLSLCRGDLEKYHLAILFQMSFVGMPTIFYGNEMGIMGESEAEYRKAMPWKDGRGELHGFFRKAVAMRHALPALRYGDFCTQAAEQGSHLLVYSRKTEGQLVTVCLCAGSQKEKLPAIAGKVYWAEGLANNELQGHGFAVFVDDTIEPEYS